MRIISKFHDYYDSVMKSGMDQEVIYVRNPKKLYLDKNFYTSKRTKSNQCDIETLLLGFCGEIYPIFKVILGNNEPPMIFYNVEDFKEFTLSRKLTDSYDFRSSRWFGNNYNTFVTQNFSELKELFHLHQVPIFTIQNHRTFTYGYNNEGLLTLNPSLKALEFQRIKDPYSAYQDIFQYVSGVLNKPENRMVNISDRDKIHKHGYNKWSFRQLPTKKK